MRIYVVRRGDTLIKIAERMLGRATRWPEIAALNHLRNSDILYVGEKLNLPDPMGTTGPSSLAGQAGTTQGIGGSLQMPATMSIGRGFIFVLFEQLPEVGTTHLVRKLNVAILPKDFSLPPSNPLMNLTPAEHALGYDKLGSQLISASNRPFGAPNFQGQGTTRLFGPPSSGAVIIDTGKVIQAGGKIITSAELIADLQRHAFVNPTTAARVKTLINAIRTLEGETLIAGGVPAKGVSLPGIVHDQHISKAETIWKGVKANTTPQAQALEELAALSKAYERARLVGRAGKTLMVTGIVFTAIDLGNASNESFEQKSIRPIAAESIRQGGGWGGGHCRSPAWWAGRCSTWY